MKKLVSFVLSLIIVFLCINTNVNAVSAKAYILVNADSLGIIKGENYNIKLPMASTTKIMTALILAEQNTPQRIVTVTKEMIAVEGSSMGLLPGDKVSFNDLLYGMLLASGNDAANVTAIVLGGSLEGFAQIMNQKAKEIGLKNTNFVTPSGLDNKNHYTTAYDLAVLTAYAIKNKAFLKAASSYKATLNYGNPPYRRTLTNHNKLLLEYEYAIGVKTGFTKKSGRCLVTAAKHNIKTVICVTLNDPDDWDDHKELLDYGLNSLTNYRPQNINNFSSIDVLCGEKDKLNVYLDFGEIGITKTEIENFNYKIYVPKIIVAPINKGQIIGKIVYYINNRSVKTFDITANESIKAERVSYFQRFLCCLKLLLN